MLHKLRKKPEHTRMMVAIVMAMVITGIVIAFWVWSMSGRFAQSKEQVGDDAKPLQALVNSFSGLFTDFRSNRDEYRSKKKEVQRQVEQEQSDPATGGMIEVTELEATVADQGDKTDVEIIDVTNDMDESTSSTE